MLFVQEYLKDHSLVDLKVDFGINSDVYEPLVVLNYSQIESPKSHPIVMECRGLILELNTWDVVCYPFRRFFNYGEVEEITMTFDFKSATGVEKIDGSLISSFYYNYKWYMSTRGKINNSVLIPLSNLTFKELFYETTKKYDRFWDSIDPAFTYTFELVSPENRVVTRYSERELYLIAMREKISLWELSDIQIREWSNRLRVPQPKLVDFSSIHELIRLAKSLQALEEGFVAVDYSKYDEDGISFKRVKVKNPSYVAISHLKDSAGKSIRSIIRLVLESNESEFLSYFPEFSNYVFEVQSKYLKYLTELNAEEKSIQELLDSLDPNSKEDAKKFAVVVKNMKGSDYFFKKFKDKSLTFRQHIKNVEEIFGHKYIEKMFVQRLKLKDVSFEVK